MNVTIDEAQKLLEIGALSPAEFKLYCEYKATMVKEAIKPLKDAKTLENLTAARAEAEPTIQMR